MTTQFQMPMLGEVMEEGLIANWLKQEGDPVERGENILEVETDKALLEVESTASGVLKQILVPVGDTVPINTTLALIE